GETVAVAAKEEDVQVGPGQADAAGERDGATVNEVGAVAVDEIGKARRATDAVEGDDLFVIELAFLDDFVEGSQNGEIAAAGTPGGMIGGDRFLGKLFARCVDSRESNVRFAHKSFNIAQGTARSTW